jgi:hypothetical protein
MSETRALCWSYGGGTQSVAIAVLVAQGKLPKPECIVIADTGREASETWEYTERYVNPMLGAVGCTIELAPHSLAKVDLFSGNGDLLIPTYTATGAMDGFCSTEWKKRVVQRHLRSKGYGPAHPVITWIGISRDEIGRAKPSGLDWQEYAWPLIWMEPSMNRRDCYELVEKAGLPTPPKSSCWMCRHRRNSQWRRLRDYSPKDWEEACRMDLSIRTADLLSGGDGVWLHESRVALQDADLSEPDSGVNSLFGEVTGCDSGMCWV